MSERGHDGGRRPTVRSARFARLKAALFMLLRLTDGGTWIAPGVLACAYPRTDRALAALQERGVRLLVNLHERPHDPARLERHVLREAHVPVEDFAVPSPAQIRCSIEAIRAALAAGEAAAVHCGGGLGRTGTVLACYLLSDSEDLGAEEAILELRALRPGSVETPAQLAAVRAWAERRIL